MFRTTHQRITTAFLSSAVLCTAAPSLQAADGDKGGLEEILVTAQRREQSLQDVPISVSVASAEQLSDAGIMQTTQLPQLTPGLVMDSAATYQQTYLRGVGSEFVQPGTNQSVATYIDGVVIVAPTALDQSLMDVERVEVLKGPQGTLFGRNAAGGAINIVTKRPSADLQAKVQVGAGNLESRNVGLYLSGPIAGALKASLAGFYNYRDGWYDNLAAPFAEKGAKQYGGRVKFLYEAENGVEAELSGHFAQQFNGENFAYQQLQSNSVGAALGGTGSARPGVVYNDSHGKHYPAWVGRYRSASGTLRVKAPLGFADFVSISGFREGVNHSGSEYDSTSADVGWFYSDILDKTWSQELQLLSTESTPIEWIAGLYWLNSDGGYDPLLVPGSPPIVSGGTQKSYAAYVQGRYEFNDQWGLTLGVRYSKDKAEYDGGIVGGFEAASPTNEEWSDTSPKLTIDYKVGDSLLYFTASKGYKAGSYNLSNLANVGPVDPEKVQALEVGIKTEIANIARLEAALFHYDYKDLQVSFIPSNNNPTELANAADSKIAGLDLNALVQATDSLKLTGGLSWLFKAEYENFPGGTAYVDNAPGPGFSVVPGDFSGNRMAHAPKLTGNVGATYTWRLADGSVAANANLHYRSKQYFSPQNLNSVANDDVKLVSAKLVYTSPDDHWTVSAWGQNLTDEEYFSGILQTTLGTIGIYALPRTYGFNVGYQW